MGSIHADLSAQHKALPDVFTSETCVSDKCRLTSGETSSRQWLQSRLDVIIRASFSQMFYINFQTDHRKIRVWSVLFTLWDWHKAHRYQKIWAHERRVRHEYTVPAQWLLEMVSLVTVQVRDRPTVHVFHHIFFNLLHVIHAPEHMQAKTLIPNTRLSFRNLNTRAAMRGHRKEYCFVFKMLVLAR